jgi:hypothetical protein
MSEPSWWSFEERHELSFSEIFSEMMGPYRGILWRGLRGFERVEVVWRDANATAGTWPEVIRLEFTPMWLTWEEERLYVIPDEDVLPGDVLVPLFAGDPERRVWRRRKWWGRGPIVPWLWNAPLDERARRRLFGNRFPRCQCRTPWCSSRSCPPF